MHVGTLFASLGLRFLAMSLNLTHRFQLEHSFVLPQMLADVNEGEPGGIVDRGPNPKWSCHMI